MFVDRPTTNLRILLCRCWLVSNSSAFLTSFSFTLEIKRLVKVVEVVQRHVAAKIKGNLLNYLSSTTMCYHVQSRIVKTDVLR